MRGRLSVGRVGGTGRGVRVVVIDSGVHETHAHVQGVSGGAAFDRHGAPRADYVDRLGHGTAVTAVIREKAPEAAVFAAKVFDRELATTAAALVAAIDWALAQDAHLVNLSLGTTNASHETALARAVERSRAAGVHVVAAAPQAEARWLPGALFGVVAVELDWAIARDACNVTIGPDGVIRIRASGFPRPIPGVASERNLKGASFAVANATGLLARALSMVEGSSATPALADVLRRFADPAEP